MSKLSDSLRSSRVLVTGLVTVIIVVGMGAIMMAVAGAANLTTSGQPVDALANSSNECVTCHRSASPGIVEQYGHSSMAGAEVTCQNCHEVSANYSGAVAHQGTYVLASPTTAKCATCHQAEVDQFHQSRHSLPAYVAYAGSKGLSPVMQQMYAAIPEGGFVQDQVKPENALHALEGPDVTQFACETCHSVGAPMPDGSVGQCQSCHLRHEFSLTQVRKPETCNACHIGPDHPQWEIYHESPHGIAYATTGDTWNWEAEPGTLSPKDFQAATCATCHISGFGQAATTHDVGDRLTWYLFAPVSERRPGWQDNMARMQSVCLQCHNEDFVTSYYKNADAATLQVNNWVKESDQIMQPLKDQGLLTAAPYDQPVDFTYFEVWHHYGRTAKFGTWMQGPDYVQWHGAYEILKGLSELRSDADEALNQAGAQE